MKKIKFLFIFMMVCVLVSISLIVEAATLFSGVYREGTKLWEPRPARSKYMDIFFGGFEVADNEVKYVLKLNLKPFDRPMYMKAEFENPLNSNAPFIEEGEISIGSKIVFPVHGPIKGLRIKHGYVVKIQLFEITDKIKPIDTLVQNIVSYLDTRGDKILVKSGLRYTESHE